MAGLDPAIHENKPVDPRVKPVDDGLGNSKEAIMNRLLAGAVRFLNGFLAVALIVIGLVAGSVSSQSSAAGALVGAIIGFVVALLACGMLALFIEMRTELIKIRMAVERSRL